MPKAERFESQIRDSLLEAANQVDASDLLKVKIHHQLFTQQNKEVSMKKVFSIKKVVVLAAVVCCLVTATVLAAGTISSYVSFSSSSDVSYTEIPTAKKLTKDLGFAPKMVECFSNGYSFKEARISKVTGQSDTGEKLSEFKELDTGYTSADGQKVTLVSGLAENETAESVIDQTENYNGIDLNYVSQVYKFVPVDYQMTQEDLEAQANGSIVFSCGSDEETTTIFQFASWTDGDVYYMLMTENTALTATDLFGMAEEVIHMQ